MSESGIVAWLRTESVSTTYLVAEELAVAVAVGDTVQAGDRLADQPLAPHIIPFAAELRVARAASTTALAALDGTTVKEHAVLGSNRLGLRMHTLRAPYTGIAQAAPDCGALIVRPDDGHETVRAAYSGIVTSVKPGEVTIQSYARRCGFAFAVGPRIASGTLAFATQATDAQHRNDAALASGERLTALAHIESVTDLSSTLRRVPGPLIVGTVSDAVAWELLARPTKAADRGEHSVIVLLGPGSLSTGASALERVRDCDGAHTVIDHHSRTITMYADVPASAEERETARATATRETVYRDPARWYEPCDIEGSAHIERVDTGYRTLVVRTSHRGFADNRTPCVNLAIYEEF